MVLISTESCRFVPGAPLRELQTATRLLSPQMATGHLMWTMPRPRMLPGGLTRGRANRAHLSSDILESGLYEPVISVALARPSATTSSQRVDSAPPLAQNAATTGSSMTIPRMILDPVHPGLVEPYFVSQPLTDCRFDSASLEILRKLGEIADGQTELIRLLRGAVVNPSHSPQQISPSAQTVASLPLTLTPGSSEVLRRDPELLAAAASPADHSAPSFSNLDRLVQASVGSSSLPLRDARESISAISQNHLSPQEYYEFGSDAAAARGNPAALRWFDLLANDVGRESVPAPANQFELVRNKDHFHQEDRTDVTPLQQATRIIDDDSQNDGAQGALDRYADPSTAGTSKRLLEKRLWQAAEDIPLMTREQILFDVFVHQISSAVSSTILLMIH